MPYPTEHAARIKAPGQFTRFVRKNLSKGIDAIIGFKQGGGSEIQAYRFKKDVFTAQEAKAWLNARNIKYIVFEAASAVQAFLEDGLDV